MTLPLSRKRGGSRRKVQLSFFIHDYLANGDASAHSVYIAYKEAVQNEPSEEFLRTANRRIRNAVVKARRTKKHERVKVSKEEIQGLLPLYMDGGEAIVGLNRITWKAHKLRNKTRCCNYNSFEHYVYILKKLGLIESTEEYEVAEGKSGSASTGWHESHPSVLLRAIASQLGSQAWTDPWYAYLGYRPVHKGEGY